MREAPFVVAAVHGIATGAVDRVALARRWAAALLESTGYEFHVVGCPWPSSGRIVEDVTKVVFDDVFRNRCVTDVMEGICRARAVAQKFGMQLVVLGHSMGGPLMTAALRELSKAEPGAWGVPRVAIGSPNGNRAFYPWFRMAGLVGIGPAADIALDFYNPDDGVPCANLLGRRDMSGDGWRTFECAVAGDGGFVGEHTDVEYLKHPLFARVLCEELRLSR